jgi:Domain of unknown function (DUF4349)
MSLLHRTHQSDDLPELTPAQLAELDALDAALAGEAIEDDALATLVRDVSAAAPQIAPSAAQQLGERVAGLGGAAKGRRLRLPLSGPAPALATAMLVVVLGGGSYAAWRQQQGAVDVAAVMDAAPAESSGSAATADDLTNRFSDTDQQAASASAKPFARADAESADRAAPEIDRLTPQSRPLETASARTAPELAESARVPGTNGGAAAQLLGSTLAASAKSRSVERSVDLSVRVKNGGIPEASAKVGRITREAAGYVSTSELSLGQHGAGEASFSLRVDSGQLDRAIDRLSGLGTVTAQNESSRDITSAVDSAKGRLRDAEQVRAALLRALAKATTAGEIASLKARIAENRRTRARLDAALQTVQRRADLTTISLTLSAPAKGDPTADDGSWGLGDAARDAWSALRAILGGMLVAAAVLAPFALLAAAGWAVYLTRRRRARERTLDA